MTTGKSGPKKIDVQPVFIFNSVFTNRLLYQLCKPPIHCFFGGKGAESNFSVQSGMNLQKQFA